MMIDVRDREMMLAAAMECPWLLAVLKPYYGRGIHFKDDFEVFDLLQRCPWVSVVEAIEDALLILRGVNPVRARGHVPNYLRPIRKNSKVFAPDYRPSWRVVYLRRRREVPKSSFLYRLPPFDLPLVFMDRKREVLRIDDPAPFKIGLDALGLLYELQGRPIPRAGMVDPCCLLEILREDGVLQWNRSLFEAVAERDSISESWVFRLWRKRPREKRSKGLPAFVLKEVERMKQSGMSKGQAIEAIADRLPLAPATVKSVYFTARRAMGVRRRLGSRHYKSGSRPE